MAAAVANRPRNHAHQPDAAAAVDQADAPPHLRDATREKGTRTTLTYQRTQKKSKETTARSGQPASSWSAGRARRAELHAAMYAHARTHQLVAELERGVREHLPVSGAAAAEDADRAEPARHGGRSVAHVDRPRS